VGFSTCPVSPLRSGAASAFTQVGGVTDYFVGSRPWLRRLSSITHHNPKCLICQQQIDRDCGPPPPKVNDENGANDIHDKQYSLWDKADRGGVAQAEVALSGAVVCEGIVP
jgi:hypothetical protein